jgi:uncharacterized membrane-anchored protein
MNKLAEMVARIPRIWLFAIAGVVQVALIALMVFDRARILHSGTEVMLKTRPVDPRDFLRGDYVVLNYDISSVDAGSLKDQPSSGKNTPVYVKLAKQPDGFHNAISVHREPVAVGAGEVLIHGYARYGANCGPDNRFFCAKIELNYGLESFFVPQGEGLELEKSRNDGKVAVIASVTSGGRAAIKRLLLDGKPVYDEPSF